jgi:hypothetical protein
MAKFLSGPPGGRTLTQTPTRISDLTGGIFGPGASAASTGLGGQRSAIKAGIARAAGETWEDVIDYYMVRSAPTLHHNCTNGMDSSMRIEAKLTSLTA